MNEEMNLPRCSIENRRKYQAPAREKLKIPNSKILQRVLIIL